ncbi:MAG TPA: MEKHLA domain-containing protein [Nitrospira sp.]|nr:MEKHLA domain-containing protein [Nitrospira sp.]
MTPIWADRRVIEWSRWLLDSHRYWTGRDLLDLTGDREAQAQALFNAPLIVVSHGTEPDPILNYGNHAALVLWDMTWERLVRTPSRLTAEAMEREERERMLEQAKSQGFFDGYRGVRVSSTGRRFLIEGAVIWTVLNGTGAAVGQAASFSRWHWLNDVNT